MKFVCIDTAMIDLMSDVRFLIFGGEIFTVGGQKSIFLSASRYQFVAIGPAKK